MIRKDTPHVAAQPTGEEVREPQPADAATQPVVSDDVFRQAADEVMRENEELFRRLAR